MNNQTTTATDIMREVKWSELESYWTIKLQAIRERNSSYVQRSYKNARSRQEGYTSLWVRPELSHPITRGLRKSVTTSAEVV
jgi:hypothetical protein